MKLLVIFLGLLVAKSVSAKSADFHVTLAELKCYAENDCVQSTRGGWWKKIELRNVDENYPNYFEGRERVEREFYGKVFFTEIFVEAWPKKPNFRITTSIGTKGNEKNLVTNRFWTTDIRNFPRYEFVGAPTEREEKMIHPILKFGPRYRTSSEAN